jgi:WD40 repeat protein
VSLRGSPAYPLGFLPDGSLVTTTTTGAAIWRIGARVPPLGVRMDAGRSLSATPIFLPRHHRVLMMESPSRAPIWHDGDTGRTLGPLLGGHDVVGDVAGSPDGRYVAGRDGAAIAIWDVRTGVRVARLSGAGRLGDGVLSALHWAPTGRAIVADVGGTAYRWALAGQMEPSSPRRVGTAALGSIDDVQFSPDGGGFFTLSAGSRRISALSSSNHVLWSRNVGDLGIHQFALSPDGRTLAIDAGTADAGRITLLDAATGKARKVRSLPSYGGVGYVDHGRWLVVTSNDPDPQAQLLDRSSLETVGVAFPTADVDQHPVVVDSTGSRFAEIVEYDAARPLDPNPTVWSADPADWLRTACALAGRNLTRAEWHTYAPDLAYRPVCPQWPVGR